MKRTKCERNPVAIQFGSATGVNKLSKIAREVIQILKDKEVNIVLLTGELGSGKTTFVKCIGKLLGIKKPITSPTFLISREYQLSTDNCQLSTLIHYDLYRLHSLNDLEEIGFWEKIDDKNNLIIIEWPDKIKGLQENICNQYKNQVIKINFSHTNSQNQRKINIL